MWNMSYNVERFQRMLHRPSMTAQEVAVVHHFIENYGFGADDETNFSHRKQPPRSVRFLLNRTFSLQKCSLFSSVYFAIAPVIDLQVDNAVWLQFSSTRYIIYDRKALSVNKFQNVIYTRCSLQQPIVPVKFLVVLRDIEI